VAIDFTARVATIDTQISTLTTAIDELDKFEFDEYLSFFIFEFYNNQTTTLNSITTIYTKDTEPLEIDKDNKIYDYRNKAKISSHTISYNSTFNTTLLDTDTLYPPMFSYEDSVPHLQTKDNELIIHNEFNSFTKLDIMYNYILEDYATPNFTDLKDATIIFLDQLKWFSNELDENLEVKNVDKNIIVPLFTIKRYLVTYRANLINEKNQIDIIQNTTVDTLADMVADVFDLKTQFDLNKPEYAGVVGDLLAGFEILVDDTAKEENPHLKVAVESDLDRLYKNWRDLVVRETRSFTQTTGTGDDKTTTTIYYDVYKLDYDKFMALPPRYFIPIAFYFFNIETIEDKACEYDQLVVVIIQFALIIAGAPHVAAAFGTVGLVVFIALNFVIMAGVGGKNEQLIAKIILFFMVVYSGYEQMALDGLTTLETLQFSVQLASGAFDLYSTYDIQQRQEKVDELKADIDELEDELDLSEHQDRIMNFIYSEQYTDAYENLYNDLYEYDTLSKMVS